MHARHTTHTSISTFWLPVFWLPVFWAAVSAVLLTACGSDNSGEGWTFDDSVDAGAACQRNEDCGEDAYCHAPPDCESPRYCADGDPPYSAAPPVLACSCGGRVISVGAGYPGRHAWSMQGAYGMEDYEVECDPDAEFPVLYTLEMQLPDERPEGLVARISSRDATEDVEVAVSPDGVVSTEILGGAWFDIFIVLIHDADGSGACSDGDAVYLGNVESRRIDMSSFEVQAQLRLQETTDPCTRW